MTNDCRKCEFYEPIGDGYGMCVKDAIPVTVVAEYEPTKNFTHCSENQKGGIMKTVYEMARDGWCDDCLGNPATCLKNGKCEGYKEDESEDT